MIDKNIKNGKLQCEINREAPKISALLSCKIDKYEYLAHKEILPSGPIHIIQQAKFTYSLLGKAFEKQTRAIEEQGKNKQMIIQIKKDNWG